MIIPASMPRLKGIRFPRETVRLWVNRFGSHFARCIRRDRPAAADKWHLDEVVIPINGVKHWLWRAVDAEGNVLDILVQSRRNAKAARCFLKKLIKRFGQPRVVISPFVTFLRNALSSKGTSCAVASNRSGSRCRVPTIAPTRD